MRRFIGAILVTVVASGLNGSARADDAKDPQAILDKAIKALGGEEKLSKVKAASWKAKGTINFGGNEMEFTSQTTAQGLDHVRSEFEGSFGKGFLVIAGDKGWRKFGEMGGELDKDQLANEKRNVHLQLVPVLILPLKGKDFKVEAAAEEKVGDKPAVGVKVTGPEGKTFSLYFDKESGLPVKLVAKVMGFMDDEHDQETTFTNYKEFDGIKKATKVEAKRDGEKFLNSEVTEFKVLDKVDPKTFTEPQ